MRSHAPTYVITMLTQGVRRTQLWHSSDPFPIGKPFRWVLERTDQGVRLRDLGGISTKVEKSTREILAKQLETGASLDLQTGDKHAIALQIQTSRKVIPVFGNKTGNALSVFECHDQWIVSSARVSEQAFHAQLMGSDAFELSRTASDWLLSSKTELTLEREGAAAVTLQPGQQHHFDDAQLASTTVRAGSRDWRFAFANPIEVPTLSRPRDAQENDFLKALRYVGIGFAAFIVMSFLWPKSENKTEELIPPQYAKIVLSKPKSAGTPDGGATSVKTSASDSSTASKAPQKVQNSAVVQAFRAKALQNAVSGLLKGGMTQLLAQSEFLNGTQASAQARRVFKGGADGMKATSPAPGMGSDKNVQVASLGGDGSGSGGVGYGKGEHAGVQGQGGSFVKFDDGNASVDEGLTKDEVGEVIHRHLTEVRYCYESAMVRTPDIQGRLNMNFTIGGNGAVKSAEVKDSTLPDPRLDDCILRRLMTWKFPTPRGGVDVSVTYPFIFKTLGR